ncbi:hypothetical protein FBUS_09503 [Fasciolopsis buskii]|uniref:Protein SPT2 homolog n=1 Tax=Fasciolopsis buskii TaxID=27845 RepID=A0A8E0RU76_9TREM|nr:hypothetical protein FBUS_09503 [Fasciolopsis buski]
MEFHEMLAIAEKRQIKRDREIEEIDQMTKRRRLERMHELEQARKIQTKVKPIIDQTDGASRETVEHHSVVLKNKLRNGIAPQTLTKSSHTTPFYPQKSLPNSSVINSGSQPVRKANSEDREAKQKPKNEKSISSHGTLVQQKPKKNNLSFAELLELAKRNEAVEPKKQAFEDLIPCSVKSLYGKKENSKSSVTDNSKSHRTTSSDASKCRQPQNKKSLKTPSAEPQKSSKGSSEADANRLKKTAPNDKIKQPIDLPRPFDPKGHIGPKSNTSVSSSKSSGFAKCSETVLSKRLQSNQGNLPRPPTHISCVSDRTVPPRSGIAAQLQSVRTISSLPHDPQVKMNQSAILSKKVDKQCLEKPRRPPQTEDSNKSLTQPTRKRQTTPEPSQVKSKPKSHVQVPTAPRSNAARPPTPRQSFRPPPTPSCRGSGIAAQLGVNMAIARAVDDSESECNYSEDDYESDDSFIDDSDVVESKEYARVVRDIHKALHFDPRKYKEVNPWDDLRSMEANYREIEKEEKRSARFGAKEDALEMERDLQRKRAKMASRGLL